MTVEQAREAKQLLELEILALVQQFEKATTLKMAALTVHQRWATTGPERQQTIRVEAEVAF